MHCGNIWLLFMWPNTLLESGSCLATRASAIETIWKICLCSRYVGFPETISSGADLGSTRTLTQNGADPSLEHRKEREKIVFVNNRPFTAANCSEIHGALIFRHGCKGVDEQMLKCQPSLILDMPISILWLLSALLVSRSVCLPSGGCCFLTQGPGFRS